MASQGGIRAGRAYVELFADDSKLRGALRSARRSIKTFAADVGKVGATMIGAGVAIGTAFVKPVNAASSLQEATAKLETVFGDSADAVKKWGDETGRQLGMSKREIRSFLSATQDLLVPVGVDEATAMEASKNIAVLARDLASFNDGTTADAFRDIQSALVGSSETMLKYGAVVHQTAVNQKLLSDGINPKSATDAQKVMARLALIFEKTTAAQGDALKTSGSYKNLMEKLNAVLEDTAAKIGEAILPHVTAFAEKLVEIVERVEKFASENKEAIIQLAALGAKLLLVGSALTGISVAILAIMSPIGGVLAAVAAMGATFLLTSGKAGRAFDEIKTGFNQLKGLAGELEGIFSNLKFQEIEVVESMKDQIKRASKEAGERRKAEKQAALDAQVNSSQDDFRVNADANRRAIEQQQEDARIAAATNQYELVTRFQATMSGSVSTNASRQLGISSTKSMEAKLLDKAVEKLDAIDRTMKTSVFWTS